MAAPAEDFPKTFPRHHDIYPGIEPSRFSSKYQGRVLLITGGSKGIGLASAKAFASAGADIFITGRTLKSLESAKAEIEEEFPKVKVAYRVADTAKQADVEASVEEAVKTFGRLDFVIANAGVMPNDLGATLKETDAEQFALVQDTNFVGAYFVARFALPYIIKTKGYIIFISSSLAQYRNPFYASYNISKHVTNRLTEYVVAEHGKDGVKSFALHPGVVPTSMTGEDFVAETFKGLVIDAPRLAGHVQLRLVSGEGDWLSGRYVDSTWDLDELSKYKDEIVAEDALKNRLALPHSLQK